MIFVGDVVADVERGPPLPAKAKSIPRRAALNDKRIAHAAADQLVRVQFGCLVDASKGKKNPAYSDDVVALIWDAQSPLARLVVIAFTFGYLAI